MEEGIQAENILEGNQAENILLTPPTTDEDGPCTDNNNVPTNLFFLLPIFAFLVHTFKLLMSWAAHTTIVGTRSFPPRNPCVDVDDDGDGDGEGSDGVGKTCHDIEGDVRRLKGVVDAVSPSDFERREASSSRAQPRGKASSERELASRQGRLGLVNDSISRDMEEPRPRDEHRVALEGGGHAASKTTWVQETEHPVRIDTAWHALLPTCSFGFCVGVMFTITCHRMRSAT